MRLPCCAWILLASFKTLFSCGGDFLLCIYYIKGFNELNFFLNSFKYCLYFGRPSQKSKVCKAGISLWCCCVYICMHYAVTKRAQSLSGCGSHLNKAGAVVIAHTNSFLTVLISHPNRLATRLRGCLKFFFLFVFYTILIYFSMARKIQEAGIKMEA